MSSPTNFEPIGACLRKVARKTPTGSAIARGIALGADDSDPEKGVLATAAKFEGFLTRDVVTARDLREIVAPEAFLELPTLAGEMATLEDYGEIEVEGAALLTLSSTGAITSSSTVGTKLGFAAGKLRVAQAGDMYFFEITANSAVASSTFPNRNGELRIRARRTEGRIPTP